LKIFLSSYKIAITKAQQFLPMRNKLIGILSLLFIFSACQDDKLIKRGDSTEVAYGKAMAFYEAENYREAAKAFDTITRTAQGTEYGQEAQYYLAESYYLDEQFLLAASEYDRYVSYYPQDERRPGMEYKAAMSYYNLSPRFKLDQTRTRTAIERFQLFISRYPNSEKVPEAANRIDELRNKLAEKSYNAALFYVRTEQYKAATIYLEETIDQFPESEWAAKALVDQARTYIEYANNSVVERQAERYTSAIEAYETFIQLFPENELRAEIENLHDEAQQKLANIETSEVTASDQD
jgi:outer membrane protein assembly factor BamD